MQKKITLRLSPSESQDAITVKAYIAASEGINPTDITGYYVVKRSIDARSRKVYVNLTVMATVNEPFIPRFLGPVNFNDVHRANSRVVIVGAGPAGLFAALELLEQGIKPIIIERGKDVRERRRDLAVLNKEGIINPESNYCFGEGGAGTYSDGKLYTRSTKRGDVTRMLQLFVHFGADPAILYEAHPHIGTNKLPQIITAIRKQILDSGGEVHFEKKLIDLQIENDLINKVITKDGGLIEADAVILATGHSARDIFLMLHKKKI